MLLLRRLPAAVVLVVVAVASSAAIAASPVSTSSKAGFSASLVVAGSEIRDPQTAWVGLDVKLDPGWHTYWKSPGDAGAPPEFNWSKSQNLEGASVEWPVPRRFTEAGLDTFGYGDRVLFPIKVRIKDPKAQAHFHLDTTLFVCSQICTSNNLHFDATLTPGFRLSSDQMLIDEWRQKVPQTTASTISVGKIDLERGPPAQLRVTVDANPPLQSPDAFVSGDDQVTAGRPSISSGAGESSTFALRLHGIEKTPPAHPLEVTIVDGDRAIEAAIPPKLFATANVSSPLAALPAPRQGGGSTLVSMLAMAVFGGLILNFMPCVFPVLSLKLFSLVGQDKRDSNAIRLRFLASAAGVVTSFLALAGVLAALKAAGAQVGWGIQFQQPIFLVLMTAVLAALSANLLGLFEIRLPWRLVGRLDQAASGSSLVSQFFNGLVMTLLATPCSAPFVGSAVAFALSQGPAEIFEIFAGLGMGMASPYLALAAVPQIARAFPRPGRWMLVVRQLAAAAIAGTALWILTVLASVSSLQTALATGASLGIIIWIAAIMRGQFANVVAAILILALGGIAFVNADLTRRPIAAAQGIEWQPLVPQKVKELAHDGRTVFVDIGAAWCLTCKVNETLIIDSKKIQARLGADVIPVRGDWTKPNDDLAAYLRSFGRYGLPFNVVFGPGAPQGIVLPELLTENAVLNAFDTASHQSSTH